jgi:anti-sigma B factor antagonist
MKRDHVGKDSRMDETAPSVEVTVTAQDATSAELEVVGDLTEDARRPLVRTMTDLMLQVPGLRRVQVDTSGVTFMNSAGVSALVQLEKMGHPRGITVSLVVASSVVAAAGLRAVAPVHDHRPPARRAAADLRVHAPGRRAPLNARPTERVGDGVFPQLGSGLPPGTRPSATSQLRSRAAS